MDEAHIQLFSDVVDAANIIAHINNNGVAVVDLNLVYNFIHLQAAAAGAWAALKNGTAKTKTFQTEMCYRLAYSKNINETQRLYLPSSATTAIAVITKQSAPVNVVIQGTCRDASYFDSITSDARTAKIVEAFRLNATEVFAMLRVKRYSTLYRDAQRFCSSAFAEQWIKRTFFQNTSTTRTLALPDLIINSPTLNRKQIDEFSNQSNCIIDTHNKVMGLPLIDFDVQKYCDAIEEASLISPDLDRTKPLFGMVRGMGGGKTRSLEEIRRQLLMKPDTLPIAITFNASWDLHNDRWESYLRPRHPCDHRLHLTLAIISRMASMLYNKRFDNIVTAIIQNINFILQSNRNASIAEYLLCAFIKCAVEDVSRHRDKPITKFVLLIDETMKLVEHIEKVYECNVDVLSMVRDVLLTDVHTVHTKEGQAYELNVALVISSLNIRPLGMTTSGRPVKPIQRAYVTRYS